MITKCLECKAEIRTYPCRVKKGANKFCSRKCCILHHTRECICLICGKRWRHPITQKDDRYCSKKCLQTARDVNVEYRKCQVCKTTFRFNLCNQRGRTKGKFCSRKCYADSMRVSIEHKAERARNYLRKYRREHPDWTQVTKARNRAYKYGASGHFTVEEWKTLKAEHNYRCLHCGEEKFLTPDHIIALTNGGTNFIKNIQPLCKSCNDRKSIEDRKRYKDIVRTA